MSNDHIQVWNRCLSKIKESVKPQSFSTWFVPIRPLRLEGSVLTIQVPNKFFFEWLEEHHVETLKKAIQTEIGTNAELKYLIPKKNRYKSESEF